MKIEKPEVLLGQGTSKHVDQASTVRHEARTLTFTLDIDIRQLLGRAIWMHCQERRECEHLGAAIYDQITPRRPYGVQEGSCRNSNRRTSVDGQFEQARSVPVAPARDDPFPFRGPRRCASSIDVARKREESRTIGSHYVHLLLSVTPP